MIPLTYITLYPSQMQALLAVMSDEQVGRLMRLVFSFAMGEENIEPDADIKMAWAIVKQQLEANAAKYQKVCEKNRENIRKRWQVQANTSEYGGIRANTEDTNGYQVKDKVKVKVKDKQEGIKRTRKVFIKPTLEEVAAYCKERGNGINPEKWMAHYEANGWKVGKAATPMVDWKACIRTWEGNNFGTRATITNEDLTSINNTRYESNDY